MSGQEVGVAYVTLIPSAKGFGKRLEHDIDAASKSTQKQQNSLFAAIQKGLKWTAVGVAAVGAALNGVVLYGGISRALNIEDARAKLKGLGHDTNSVKLILADALASVKGTAFGLDAAATTAAAAVAAGIKPGQQLEKYLRLTADAATIAGVSMEEMGAIINKVTARGVAQMEMLNQLSERGIPIIQWLAEEYGVTAEELTKMVSRGLVDAETFRRAIEKNISGAALAAGETTRGAFANMRAAISRFGEMLIGEAGLGAARTFFNEVTVVFDGLAALLKPVVATVHATLGEMFTLEGLGERILAFIEQFNIGETLTAVMAGRANIVAVGIRIVNDLVQGLVESIPALIVHAQAMIQRVLATIQQYAPMILQGAVTLFLGLATGLIQVIPQLVASVQLVAVDLVNALVDALPTLISGATELFLGLVTALSQILPKLLTALTGALPQIIGAVVSMIPAVVTALAAALPQIIEGAVQLFLGLVVGVAEALPDIITAVVGIVPTLITALVGMIPVLIEGAVQLLMGMLQALPVVIPALIQGVLGGVVELINALIESIPALLDGAIQLFTSLIEALPVILPELVIAIVNLVPTITTTLIGMIPTLLGAAINLFMALVEAIPHMLQKLGSALTQVWPKIWDALKDIPGRMLNAGKDMVRGLVNGIKSMISHAVNTVKDLGGQMLSGIKGFLGIHSPSRVFRDEVGKMIGAGLLAGVDDPTIRGRINTSVTHLVDIPQIDSPTGVSLVQHMELARDLDPTVFARKTARALSDVLVGVV